MKSKSTIIALALWLSLFGLACSKSDTAVANMSEDDKHKIFQAVGMTQDLKLAAEVFKKIGLIDASGQPTPAYEPFLKEHAEWGTKNVEFVRENLSKEKARAYVDSHMPK